MAHKFKVMTHTVCDILKTIQALKERENHMTNLKNKRKTKDRPSQSNTKVRIHGHLLEI